MGDDSAEEDQQEEKKFFVDIAKTGRATCKKCKQKIDQGTLRLAKAGYNPFGSGPMKMWHHVPCLFEVFSRQRPTTARINSPDDIEGWDTLEEEHQEEILKFLGDAGSKNTAKTPTKTPKKASESTSDSAKKKTAAAAKEHTKQLTTIDASSKFKSDHKDNSFREFRRLCAAVAETDSYTGKTAHIKEFFTKGSEKSGFHGDLQLWCRLLLPGAVKRVYNLQSKQLIKLFSRIFHTDQDEMLEHLEQGDVADTITVFFEKSTHLEPTKKSTLTLQDVDNFLEKLSTMTREEEQTNHFKNIARRCTANDLKMIIRLIKHDLRINAGPKHILEAVHPDAYQAFQTSRDLEAVISRVLTKSGPLSSGSPIKKGALKISVSLMTPVLPMLAEACKSVEYAMKKCPNGMYSEIKYDGERVQVHKKGDEFKYFSRSLKPVMRHKIQTFEQYIPQAFPHGKDLILDSEVLMVDLNTGKPLPFGTLGVHKKTAFKDANVCLFVFDCIYYNGEVLLNRPIKERRKILHDNMKEIPNHVMFSEMEEVHDPKDLENMITKVLRLGLEGLVLKDLMSTYEPGKRHWLKVKKDYLFGGAMADSADLVVLGAWFGTGQKGGMMSVFLMGCYDPAAKKWRTVTKVHTGHDDKTLERLQDELDMIKISKEASKVPDWLSCTKTMIPDFVARDPKKMPVWEISGAEFTQHDVHTADGISIRFPRVTRIRDDKNWETATTLPELKVLFKKSKESENFTLFSSNKEREELEKQSTSSKRKNGTPKKELKDEKHSTSPEHKNRSENSSSPSDLNNSDDETPPKKKNNNKDAVHKESLASVSLASDEEQFSEKETEPPPKKNKASLVGKPKKPLPDVFEGIKLILPEKVEENRSELERYFIAYGGELLEEDQKEQSTHVVHLKNTAKKDMDSWPREARHVTAAWLWDSIKNQKLQDTRRYTVYAKSL